MFYFLNVRKRDTWDTLRGWQVESMADEEDGSGRPNRIVVCVFLHVIFFFKLYIEGFF